MQFIILHFDRIYKCKQHFDSDSMYNTFTKESASEKNNTG